MAGKQEPVCVWMVIDTGVFQFLSIGTMTTHHLLPMAGYPHAICRTEWSLWPGPVGVQHPSQASMTKGMVPRGTGLGDFLWPLRSFWV